MVWGPPPHLKGGPAPQHVWQDCVGPRAAPIPAPLWLWLESEKLGKVRARWQGQAPRQPGRFCLLFPDPSGPGVRPGSPRAPSSAPVHASSSGPRRLCRRYNPQAQTRQPYSLFVLLLKAVPMLFFMGSGRGGPMSSGGSRRPRPPVKGFRSTGRARRWEESTRSPPPSPSDSRVGFLGCRVGLGTRGCRDNLGDWAKQLVQRLWKSLKRHSQSPSPPAGGPQ